MSEHDIHVGVLDEKITALSKALADLGRGTSLQDLLRIIRFPGYTTPAEFASTVAMVDSMAAQVSFACQAGTRPASGRQTGGRESGRGGLGSPSKTGQTGGRRRAHQYHCTADDCYSGRVCGRGT
jgi:hypothetical protein